MTDATPHARSRYALVAFDWDGTLFDSTAIITRCIQRAVADVGGRVPSDEQAAYVIGMGLAQALAHAAPDVPVQDYPALAARYRYHYMAQQDDIHLFEGVVPLLHELRARGVLLAVATGKSRRGLDVALRAVELQGLFDSSRTADETASKPHPQMLLELMEEFSLQPRQVLMVGDTTHDLEMAQRAGCDSVGVGYGAHDTGGFAAWSPRYVAHTVAELQQWMHAHV
ncbi:MAG: HAD family hydrolase [Rhodoferax sp.]